MSNSDKVVKPDKTVLHGNAATLYLASKNGGMDQYLGKMLDVASVAAGRAAVEKFKRTQRRPTLIAVPNGK
ncbi:hypothetical protein SJI19_16705 [Acerihabitans sp. TG2]|uniref:hypothetical protein n=1 Tax=Acerihabitans sp. TG2 TaxID=3096008 RepID=UPI002B23902A|nr:hypothetical protein [Acerihabitans sp. TG2]MEA9392166.1 hypothetical protein [Acerihabitans sp. TG2]